MGSNAGFTDQALDFLTNQTKRFSPQSSSLNFFIFLLSAIYVHYNSLLFIIQEVIEFFFILNLIHVNYPSVS